jgi:hypothetical protein
MVCSAAAIGLIGLAALPAGAQTVGITAAIRNDVELKTNAAPSPHQAVLKEHVALGNDVSTGRASMAQLLLLDQTTFSIGANARMRIDRFVYDPDRNASAVSASVVTGAFRFMSGKALHANPGQSLIHTPVATIGIRGTMLDGIIGEEAIRVARKEGGITVPPTADPEKATLIVLRGPGKLAQGGETPGAIDITVDVSVSITLDEPGMALFIPGPGQAPIGPFHLSDSGGRRVSKMLRTQPNYAPFSPWVADPGTNTQFECAGGLGAGGAGCFAPSIGGLTQG